MPLPSLSKFSAAPRKGWLEIAQHILGYLKNLQTKGTSSMSSLHSLKKPTRKWNLKQILETNILLFHRQHGFPIPEPKIKESGINMFVDAD